MKLTLFAILTVHLSLSQNLDDFIGSWQGEGNLFGNNAKFTMTWSKVLNENFYHLEFENVQIDKKLKMSAKAFYRLNKDSISGHWFDSRGVTLPLKGDFINSMLTVYWGSDKTERGKTTYSIMNKEIHVNDFVFIKDKYTKFGSAIYKKN